VSTKRLIAIALVMLLGVCISGNVSTAACTQDDPTAITLRSVDAIPTVRTIEVRWATDSEFGTAGFNVMRSTSDSGPWEQANASAIPAIGGDIGGASYKFVDDSVAVGITYYYYIQEILESGGREDHMGDWIRSARIEGAYLPLVLVP